jgi:hypothetical protein
MLPARQKGWIELVQQMIGVLQKSARDDLTSRSASLTTLKFLIEATIAWQLSIGYVEAGSHSGISTNRRRTRRSRGILNCVVVLLNWSAPMLMKAPKEKLLKFAILTVAAGFALGLATILPVKAQEDVKAADLTFALRVCNESGVRNVYMAVLSASDRPEEWHLRGWYAIPNSGCTFLNRHLRPTFYTYARGGGYHWGENDSRQCVNPIQAFDRTIGSKDYECTSREITVGFKEREVDPNQDTYEITLR